MGNRSTPFKQIIDNEIDNRFLEFCCGNNGSDSFCSVKREISSLEDWYSQVNPLREIALDMLYKQCERCTVLEFIKFSKQK